MAVADEEVRPEEEQGPTWTRLQDQIGWYDRAAKSNQNWFKAIKVVQLALGALVPVVAAAGGARWILGAFGGGVVALEGVQQLFQFHRNWISYRATCEALRREQHLFQVRAGTYATANAPLVMLAERLEALVGRETGEWAAAENALHAADGAKREG